MTADEASPSDKGTIRRRVAAARAGRSEVEQDVAGAALCTRVLGLAEVEAAGVVAAYVSVSGEPVTRHLLETLDRRGTRVLLPVLRADYDLDWARYVAGRWREGRYGIIEPAGPLLGVDAITSVDVVICPGVGGDVHGHRLGRGGGSYDRVLARVTDTTLRVLLLYDEEVLAGLPVDPHDQRVDVLVTPTRTIRSS